MPPLQIAAYTFGVFNALICVGLFFYATHGSGLSLLRRAGLCTIGISAIAYLSLRTVLIYQGIH